MTDNSTRDEKIGKLLDTKKYSYAVIAEMVGTTRNAVGGVAFRRRHNVAALGYQPRSYLPEKTALNTR